MDMLIPAELEAVVPVMAAQAKALTIRTADEFTAAGEFLVAVKGRMKAVIDFFKPLKQKQDEAKRVILDAEKKVYVPLAEAEVAVKQAMTLYHAQEERKRLAEQARLQAEADEKARREREALLKRSDSVKSVEKKQQYAEAAAQVMAPVVHVETHSPVVSGISTRRTWKARVVDPNAVPREFLMIDEAKLQKYAQAMKSSANVAGVVFYEESSLAVKGRAS